MSSATEGRTAWKGGPHGSSRTDGGPARRTHAVWPSGRPGQPVRGRALGEILVLRDAHDPRLLPLLNGHRWWPRTAEEHRDRHRGRVRRAGLPLDRARGLDRRPPARHGTHGALRRCGGDVRPHRSRGDSRSGRGGRRPRVGGARLGCAEGQRIVLAGHLVRQGRSAMRWRFHALLPRYHPWRLHRAVDHGPAADTRRTPLRLRRGGGVFRRDAHQLQGCRGRAHTHTCLHPVVHRKMRCSGRCSSRSSGCWRSIPTNG